MDKFDEKVIGYESTKDILRQILDILKRPEVYNGSLLFFVKPVRKTVFWMN